MVAIPSAAFVCIIALKLFHFFLYSIGDLLFVPISIFSYFHSSSIFYTVKIPSFLSRFLHFHGSKFEVDSIHHDNMLITVNILCFKRK